MIASVGFGGVCFTIASFIFLFIFALFCMGIFKLILVDLVRLVFGMSEKAEESMMFVCFFLGFMVGVGGGSFLMLQIAIWLGFQAGELPTLPTWR